MNEGRIWTVVSPNKGVPMFLAGVALTVLAVHYAILSNTTWFAAYWQGGAKAVATAPAAASSVAAAPTTAP